MWRVAAGAALLTAGLAQAAAFDAALAERIDAFVESEVQASGIPGVALAVLSEGRRPHLRGFGHDGLGRPVTAETPFPIGSLTKSFTALLVRQAIDAGQLDADAPVQRYLPWFRVADAEASARITLRHLLNQTSGFSRADGIAPLMERSAAGIEELVRGMSQVTLNRPVGERFEYSNLNFVALAAVLQQLSNKPWEQLLRERVLQPLAMTNSRVGYEGAPEAGMTAVHRMWFGWPVAQQLQVTDGMAPTGGLVAPAADMARYLQMLLAGGETPSGRIASSQSVSALLAPASPPARTTLLSTTFDYRYGEGWFVGPFGAAADARWHLGSLASFAAWMVLLPESKQAVVLLINANCELPINQAGAVMSRLPIGVVNLLRGQEPPQGPSLREAYRPFNALVLVMLLALALLAAWASRRARGPVVPLFMAVVGLLLIFSPRALGLSAPMLAAFAPDLALAGGAGAVLLGVPLAWRLVRRLVRREGARA